MRVSGYPRSKPASTLLMPGSLATKPETGVRSRVAFCLGHPRWKPASRTPLQ